MKKLVKKVSIMALSVVFLASCDNLERTVELDLNQVEQRIVIEGLVTNKPGQQFVKVSKNVGFYDQGQTPKVSGALVTISDDAGNNWELPESGEEKGYYSADFLPVVGRTYSLSVTVEGQTYEATETLRPITTLDSLAWGIDEDEQEDPEDAGYFYDLLVYVTEPQETEDFYLFKFYRNDSIQNFDNTWAYTVSDEFLQENIEGVRGPVYFAQGDVARIEAYSISKEAYVFYNDLNQVLNNDGGLFGPIPANLRNNLSNGALGYFQVSAMTEESIVIGGDDQD